MKKTSWVAMVALLCGYPVCGAVDSYDDLITETASACRTPGKFLTDDFTNSVVRFHDAHTGLTERCAADLSLALALTYKRNHEDGQSGDLACYDRCVGLLTNIVGRKEAGLPSWIRYAAMFEHVVLLNEDDKKRESFNVSTNALTLIEACSPDVSVTNFWNDLISFEGCAGAAIQDAFRLNAALTLADEGRWSEVPAYTNRLSPALIKTFRKDVR